MNTTTRNQMPGQTSLLNSNLMGSDSECPRTILRFPEITDDFQNLEDPELVVEMQTIPGFLRLIPHKFTADDVKRFGKESNAIADAFGVSFTTTVDRALGQIRVFPIHLLKRVYERQRKQYGWPLIIEAEQPALEGVEKLNQALRDKERAAASVRELIADTDNLSQIKALRDALAVIEFQINELRSDSTSS